MISDITAVIGASGIISGLFRQINHSLPTIESLSLELPTIVFSGRNIFRFILIHKLAIVTYLKGSASILSIIIFLNFNTAVDNTTTSALQYLTNSCLKFQSLTSFCFSYQGLKLSLYSLGIRFSAQKSSSHGIHPT